MHSPNALPSAGVASGDCLVVPGVPGSGIDTLQHAVRLKYSTVPWEGVPDLGLSPRSRPRGTRQLAGIEDEGAAGSPAGSGSRSTILIVDDAPTNLGLMVESLESNGYRVLVAQDGEEGLLRATCELPDLVLLDVMMPGLDGFAVCRQLRANQQTSHVPVILMSAMGEVEDKIAGFDAGAVDYVTKPLQIAEVTIRVRTHLEMSTLRRQLATQNEELRRCRGELEQRVESRTAELTAEINERRRTELALQRSSGQILDLYNNAPCGYHSLDANGVYVQVNQTELKWLGYSREELVGRKKFVDLLTARSARPFARTFPQMKEKGVLRDVELQLLRRDGSTMPVLMSASSLYDESGQFVMSRTTLYDLTERKRIEERIIHMSHHDALTGLPNRAALQNGFNHLAAKAQGGREGMGVMFIDLDRFKQINDSLGHDIGDLLLHDVAIRLSQCLRKSDTLARWGDDEFVVLLPGTEQEDAVRRTGAEILGALSTLFLIEKYELQVSGSIGAALYPRDGRDLRSLVYAAEAAMHHAKREGRNKLAWFKPEMARAVERRASLAAQLRQALGRDELFLDYQPQVDMATGRIVGVEALARWRHPEAGLIPPSDFIPIAEEAGLIQALGEWSLRQACTQVKQWRDAGHQRLTVSVNVSVQQLTSGDFDQCVERILEDTGCPPDCVELEITENLLMQSNGDNLRVLNRLHDRGLQLTVDDFGIGYSSLSYLHSFPIHALKIDRSFVSRIEHKQHNGAIVAAIIAMARSLHLRLVAEGVETPEQVAFLQAHGCRVAQGYLYSRPTSPEQLQDLLVRVLPT